MNCKTCNIEYLSDRCAATLYLLAGTYYILAHYGSAYDMQRYALKRDKYEVGDICDDCIRNYIDRGNAHLIEDGVW